MNDGLPNLSGFSRQLASDARRVDLFVDTLPGVIEHLVLAMDSGDTSEIERIAHEVSVRELPMSDVQTAAAELSDVARNAPADHATIRRKMTQLISRTRFLPKRLDPPYRNK